MSDSSSDDARELEALGRLIQQRAKRPRDPKPIADAINRLLARRGYARQEATQQLVALWQTAAGGGLAKSSRPGNLKRGVLEIIVRNSTVLQELTFQKRQLLRRLQAAEGGSAIEDLRFRIGTLD